MLVKDKEQYCWCFYGDVGNPQDSIEQAIDDYLDYFGCYCWDENFDVEYLEQDTLNDNVEVGHPYYYVPEVDGKRVIYDLLDNDLPEELAECDFEYFKGVKKEHISELSEKLTEVFQKWEKSNGLNNRVYCVKETKMYRIGDYIDTNGDYI